MPMSENAKIALLMLVACMAVIMDWHVVAIQRTVAEMRDTQLYQIQIQSENRDTTNMIYDAITSNASLEDNRD